LKSAATASRLRPVSPEIQRWLLLVAVGCYGASLIFMIYSAVVVVRSYLAGPDETWTTLGILVGIAILVAPGVFLPRAFRNIRPDRDDRQTDE
jgi:hypothetical protein